MPAKSKAQQKLMGMVHAAQSGQIKSPSEKVQKLAKSMTKKSAADYASTKHKGLPKKVKKKPMKENMDYENKVGQLHMVQKPYSGCNMASLVYEVDPITGIQKHGVDAQTVHGVYPTQEEAQKVAEKLYNEHMSEMKKLEEKKGTVSNKLSKAITTLEKKHKDLMEMAKANPKEAASHKSAISEIQAKIQELMSKLEMVEKSKKPIETEEEEEKETLKEEAGGSFEGKLKDYVKSTLKFSDEDAKLKFYKNKATLDYKRGTRMSDNDVEALEKEFKVFPHSDESDDRTEYYYYTVQPKNMSEAQGADYGKWEYLADMVEDAMFAWLEAHDYELGDDTQIETDAEELTSKIVSKYINSAYTDR